MEHRKHLAVNLSQEREKTAIFPSVPRFVVTSRLCEDYCEHF